MIVQRYEQTEWVDLPKPSAVTIVKPVVIFLAPDYLSASNDIDADGLAPGWYALVDGYLIGPRKDTRAAGIAAAHLLYLTGQEERARKLIGDELLAQLRQAITIN